MAYVQGGLIEAVDFNTFRSQLLQIYGVGNGNFGYGQTAINVPSVSGGLVEVVKSLEWTNLRNAIDVCRLHQGINGILLPPTGVLEPGDLIIAHDGITDAQNFPQMLSDITANRLTAPATSMTLTNNKSVQTVSNSWSNQASTIVDIVWPTPDEARYFFNSSGRIRIQASRSGGAATSQNSAWSGLLSSVGVVEIDHANVTNTGTVGTINSLGYYDLLNSSPSQIFQASPSGGGGGGYYYFNANNFRISAQVLGSNGANSANGDRVRLNIEFNDNYTGGSDTVDGDLTVRIGEWRATTHLTTTPFTVNVVTPLTAI